MSFSRAASLLELLERPRFFRNSALDPGSWAELGPGDVNSRGARPARGGFTFHWDEFQAWRLHLKFPGGEEAGAGPVGGREGRLQPGIQLCLPHSEHISSLFPSFDEGTAEFISQQAMEKGGKSGGSCSRSFLRGLRGAEQETEHRFLGIVPGSLLWCSQQCWTGLQCSGGDSLGEEISWCHRSSAPQSF